MFWAAQELGATRNISGHQTLVGAHNASAESHEQLFVNLSPTGYAAFALVTFAGLLVSLVSNMIIIYLFMITPSLRRIPSNIMAVNLSLSDLLYCIQWPSVIYCSLTKSTWILDLDYVCQSFGFMTVSTGLASVLTVVAMSIERAIVITYSIYAKRRFTIRGAWLTIVLIWALAIASTLPPLFGKFNRYTLDPSKTSCTLDYLSEKPNHRRYILVLIVSYWIAPTVILFISYGSILFTFKKSSLDLKEVESSVSHVKRSSSERSAPMLGRFGNRLRDSVRLQAMRMATHSSQANSVGAYRDEVDRPMLGVECRFEPSPRRTSMRSSSNPSSCELSYETVRHSAGHNAALSSLDQSPGTRSLLTARCELEQPPDTHKSLRATERRAEQSGGAQPGAMIEPSRFHESIVAVLSNKLRNSGSVRSRARVRGDNVTQERSRSGHASRTVLQFRLAKMSFYLIVLWLVSWTPIAWLAAIHAALPDHKFSATAIFLANTMTKLGPAFDVFIYGSSHPKIKSKFRQIFKRLFMFGRAPDLFAKPAPRRSLSKVKLSRLSLWSVRQQTSELKRRESWDSTAGP